MSRKSKELYIWQLNIFRAKFEDAMTEIVETQKLYWKIEYGNDESRCKEYTPAAKRKPAWNYWTQIRDDPSTTEFHFALLSKSEGKQELGSFKLELQEYRKHPDEQNRIWMKILNNDEHEIGELQMSITYKAFEIESGEDDGRCSKLNVYCMNNDEASCSVS